MDWPGTKFSPGGLGPNWGEEFAVRMNETRAVFSNVGEKIWFSDTVIH
jgi:hypothetical protein